MPDVVAPPATDRPAGADHATATLFALLVRRMTVLRRAAVILGVLAALILLIKVAAGFTSVDVLLLPLFAAVLGLTWWQVGTAQARYGGWLPHAAALLSTTTWRKVNATVLRGGDRPVLEVEDVDRTYRLRCGGLHAAAQQVVARAGHVWLIGPDEAGWSVVRVPGLHAPWAARVGAEPVEPMPVPAPRPGAEDTAAADPVALAWAEDGVRVQRRGLAVAVGMIVVGAVIVLRFGFDEDGWLGMVWGGLVVLLGARALHRAVRQVREARAVLGMLAAGPWTPVPVTLRPWQSPAATVDATGTARLGEDRTLAITLPRATVDLLASVEETGTLWFAGEPAPGATVVVGFPGYPLLGIARC